MNKMITNVDCLCGVIFGMSSRYKLMNCQLSINHIRFVQLVILCIVLLLVLFVGCCFHGCIGTFVWVLGEVSYWCCYEHRDNFWFLYYPEILQYLIFCKVLSNFHCGWQSSWFLLLYLVIWQFWGHAGWDTAPILGIHSSWVTQICHNRCFLDPLVGRNV